MLKIMNTAVLNQVASQATHVRIDHQKAHDYASYLPLAPITHWSAASPFDLQALSPSERLGFLFTFNTISFSYWGSPKWMTTHHNNTYDRGTWAMIASLMRAREEGLPITDSAYLGSLTRVELAHILRGNTEIPLLDDRLAALHELGYVTIQRYGGRFEQVVEAAHGDAPTLVNLIVTAFPHFEDVSSYRGLDLPFRKRAQLLTSDIGCSFGCLHNLEALTACADYKLPLVLENAGVLMYAPTLAEQIRNQVPLPHDSEEEIEIRACTLLAVELIKQASPRPVTSMQINDYLWLAAGQLAQKPYHLTRTTAY